MGGQDGHSLSLQRTTHAHHGHWLSDLPASSGEDVTLAEARNNAAACKQDAIFLTFVLPGNHVVTFKLYSTGDSQFFLLFFNLRPGCYMDNSMFCIQKQVPLQFVQPDIVTTLVSRPCMLLPSLWVSPISGLFFTHQESSLWCFMSTLFVLAKDQRVKA